MKAKSSADQGASRLDLTKVTPSYKPVNDATFKGFLSHYQYDKKPLNARVIQTVETADWRREKIHFDGPNGDSVFAYLYLPKRAAKPFQCINLVPHSGALRGMSIPQVVEPFLIPHLKSGRALMAVVLKGVTEREWPKDYVPPQAGSVGYREQTVLRATELSLGLDYLATRNDINMSRVAYLGLSWGAAGQGLVFAAVEDRYRAVVLMGGGVSEIELKKLPEVSSINFAPRIKPPKLMLSGKYDEDFAYRTQILPLYDLLPQPKVLSLSEGGHATPTEIWVPVVGKFLDETLGPVRYE